MSNKQQLVYTTYDWIGTRPVQRNTKASKLKSEIFRTTTSGNHGLTAGRRGFIIRVWVDTPLCNHLIAQYDDTPALDLRIWDVVDIGPVGQSDKKLDFTIALHRSVTVGEEAYVLCECSDDVLLQGREAG